MLKDLVPLFEREMREHPEIIWDNYNLKEGLYIRFDIRKTIEENLEDLNYLIIKKKEEPAYSNLDLLSWFKRRDYYSSVLNDDMNKCLNLPAKKIHNTNALTLFIKSELFLGAGKKLKPVEVKIHIQDFFDKGLSAASDSLLNLYPITGSNRQEKQRSEQSRKDFFETHYGYLLEHLESENRKNLYEQAKAFWTTNFETFAAFLDNFSKKHSFSNYVKVFFDAEESFYRNEYEIYILPKIFNVNKFNVVYENGIYGLPAYDVTMNSKKPYLELKTMKTEVPTRVSLEDALLIKDLYKWLETKGKMQQLIISTEVPFAPVNNKNVGQFHIWVNGSGGLDYFENVPFRAPSEWGIEIENVLFREEKTDQEWIFKSYDTIQTSAALHKAISYCFFAGRLGASFLNAEPPKVNEGVFTSLMQSILVIMRQSLYDFIYKGSKETVHLFIEKYSRQLIEEQIIKTVEGLAVGKMADAYNLRLALMNYLGYEEGKELADLIKVIYNDLNNRLNSKAEVVSCQSDEEFVFLGGQLGYYLLDQSEASNRRLSMMEPVLQAKTSTQLKRKLEDLLAAYGHEIRIENLRFKNAFAMVMGYETDLKLQGTVRDMLLAGLLAKNLFYEKKGGE